ncbi:hypothetical protein EMCG_08194, partial [[Emmonsia] crescens]
MADNSSPDYKALYHRAEVEQRQAEEQERQEAEFERHEKKCAVSQQHLKSSSKTVMIHSLSLCRLK